MRIGVISEGHADRAVITNILTGLTGLDRNDIIALRPDNNLDETDKANINPLAFSTWSVVKEECETRQLIDGFLEFEDHDFIVIHIDTAEASLYGVTKPNNKSDTYCDDLRALVIQQINAWLKVDISNMILYAIAVEETEAWILPIYSSRDSSKLANPKRMLDYLLGKKGIITTSDYSNFLSISKPLSKEREVRKGNYLMYNNSLNAFFEEIKDKVLPKLQNNL